MPALAETSIRPRRADLLPRSLPPRGLSRTEAAAYVGISASLFDQLVADGRMPRPKRVNARAVWDVRALDRAFDELPDERGGIGGIDPDANPWDD